MTDPIIQAAMDAMRVYSADEEALLDTLGIDDSYAEQVIIPKVLAAVTPLIREQIADEIEAEVSSVYRQQREFDDGVDVGLEEAARIARGDAQ